MKLHGEEKEAYLSVAVDLLVRFKESGSKYVSWSALGRSIAQMVSDTVPDYRVYDEAARCKSLRKELLPLYQERSGNYAARLGFPEKRRLVPGLKENTLHAGRRQSEGIWLVPSTEALERSVQARAKTLKSVATGMTNTCNSSDVNRREIIETLGSSVIVPALLGSGEEHEQ